MALQLNGAGSSFDQMLQHMVTWVILLKLTADVWQNKLTIMLYRDIDTKGNDDISNNNKYFKI